MKLIGDRLTICRLERPDVIVLIVTSDPPRNPTIAAVQTLKHIDTAIELVLSC